MDDPEEDQDHWRLLKDLLLGVAAVAGVAVAFAGSMGAKIGIVGGLIAMAVAWYLGYVMGSRGPRGGPPAPA